MIQTPADLSQLDARTLRTLARLHDVEATRLHAKCPCLLHAVLGGTHEEIATTYRSWAFSARGGAPVPSRVDGA